MREWRQETTNPRHHNRRRTKRRNRMCSEKVRYPDEMEAMRAAVRTGNTWYRCPYCHGYHLTSSRRAI